MSLIPKNPQTDLQIITKFDPTLLIDYFNKILERVIRFQLHGILDQSNIPIPEQFGFRVKHSTQHKEFRVLELFSVNLKIQAAALF